MNTSASVYLDYAASTPCDARVVEAMLPHFTHSFGNPSSRSHRSGRSAAQAVEAAREKVAVLLGARPSEVVWTSGATEANNLAIQGVGINRLLAGARGHVISSSIEHSSVLEPLRRIERLGFDVSLARPTAAGDLDVAAIATLFRPYTIMVSLSLGNGEIGTAIEVSAIAEFCHAQGVLLHADGSQFVGKMPFDFAASGIDLLSCSAHKIYGPKGVGCLVVRRGEVAKQLDAVQVGGGQERGLRAGTLNVPGIVGFGAACEILSGAVEVEMKTLSELRDELEQCILTRCASAQVNARPRSRVPHITNIGFHGVDGVLMDRLDGVECSTGAACASADPLPSRVLLELGIADHVARNSLRLSVGRSTKRQEIATAVDRIARAVEMGD